MCFYNSFTIQQKEKKEKEKRERERSSLLSMDTHFLYFYIML